MALDKDIDRLLNPPRTERRRCGRLVQESLASNYGPVVDVSSEGLRIRCLRVPTLSRGIELTGLVGGTLRLEGEVVWSRRNGLLRSEVGIRLKNLDVDARNKLRDLSLGNRMERGLHREAA